MYGAKQLQKEARKLKMHIEQNERNMLGALTTQRNEMKLVELNSLVYPIMFQMRGKKYTTTTTSTSD